MKNYLFICENLGKISLPKVLQVIIIVACTKSALIKKVKNQETIMNLRKKIKKISKGYRLKPETHNLVHKIQEMINGDQDEAIANACRMYYHKISSRETKNNLRSNPGFNISIL